MIGHIVGVYYTCLDILLVCTIRDWTYCWCVLYVIGHIVGVYYR